MRIGFGAISKGYAADRAKYILQMMGVSSGVINAGGDLLTWGLQPDNEPWTIASADPERETAALFRHQYQQYGCCHFGQFREECDYQQQKIFK